MAKWIIMAILLMCEMPFAQPQTQWMRAYDFGNDQNENICDIFLCANEGMIACGRTGDNSLIFKVDNDGDIDWVQTYPNGSLATIVETDASNFIAGGVTPDEEPGWSLFSALLVNDNGEQIWRRSYGNGRCYAIIELKSGEFLLSGYTTGSQGIVIMIDGEGNSVWSETYPNEAAFFSSMRETAGGVVLSGSKREDRDWQFISVKINFEGEVLWSHVYDLEFGNICWSIDSVDDQGFILGGIEIRENVKSNALLRIDDDGEVLWSHVFPENGASEECNCVIQTNNEGFCIAGNANDHFQHLAYGLNHNGLIRWRNQIDFNEEDSLGGIDSELSSVIELEDNSILAAGTINNANGEFGQDGFIVKLEPEILGPSFIAWTPEDTVLTALLDEAVEFSVEARNQQGDELEYEWYFADTLRGRQSIQTIIFDSLGVFEVQCRASDAEFTTAITWHITVSDFFIRETAPDTLHITARRGSTHCPSRLMSRALSRMRPLSSGQRSTAITTVNIWAKRIRLTCCSISLASGLSKLKRSGVKSVNPFAGMSPSAPPSGGGCRMRTRSRSINTNEAISQSFPSTRTRIV